MLAEFYRSMKVVRMRRNHRPKSLRITLQGQFRPQSRKMSLLRCSRRISSLPIHRDEQRSSNSSSTWPLSSFKIKQLLKIVKIRRGLPLWRLNRRSWQRWIVRNLLGRLNGTTFNAEYFIQPSEGRCQLFDSFICHPPLWIDNYPIFTQIYSKTKPPTKLRNLYIHTPFSMDICTQ